MLMEQLALASADVGRGGSTCTIHVHTLCSSPPEASGCLPAGIAGSSSRLACVLVCVSRKSSASPWVLCQYMHALGSAG